MLRDKITFCKGKQKIFGFKKCIYFFIFRRFKKFKYRVWFIKIEPIAHFLWNIRRNIFRIAKFHKKCPKFDDISCNSMGGGGRFIGGNTQINFLYGSRKVKLPIRKMFLHETHKKVKRYVLISAKLTEIIWAKIRDYRECKIGIIHKLIRY